MLFSLCLRFCGLTQGWGLNTNINLFVTLMSRMFGYFSGSSELPSPDTVPSLFLSICDLSAHRCTCQHHGWLASVFPTNTGSFLIVRDPGWLYGPLFHTSCASVSCDLTWPTAEGHFLSAGCSLRVPGGDCLFSINLSLFLMGWGSWPVLPTKACSLPTPVSLCGSFPHEAECCPLPTTNLS